MRDEKLEEAIRLFTDVMVVGQNEVFRKVEDELHKEFSMEQIKMLNLLERHGPLTSKQLTEFQGGHKSATSSRLKKLVDKEYVEVTPDAEDRRVKYIALTDKGGAAYREANHQVNEYLSSVLEGIKDEEVDQFIFIFQKVKDLLRQQQ
ncbi:DNA-binding MarR family transcriptional regulator [Salibacterium salarium]|uniref:MarR family transcriptional regulator n=1 Tax=Salibacterium salarium TaxID=284579 RepID=A0A428NA62_9BACI|nr:MarR family transcriptional regulator [Salibacterium salarium]MDQ0298036.1 DNA-binding MarR family transcriptional regulator [Salibacterium salarium]RSL35277.1 MarR family transcriptional regulator [Salibacterium salarium]